MASSTSRGTHAVRSRRRSIVAGLLVAVIVAACVPPAGGVATPAPSGVSAAIGPAGSPGRPMAPAAGVGDPGASPGAPPAVDASPSPPPDTSPTASPGASPDASPGVSPTPSPVPTPALAVAPLTGRLVSPALAIRHPIAVMVDDHWDARPQSGFTEASVVWQAPAEGGIPRYMLVFAEGNPASVGPVRSARLYFVQWAAEWNAVYVHVGGSPQAMALLRAKGQGQLVYDADEYRWGRIYLWRTTDRFPPHNVYTDGKSLRAMARRVGAKPVDEKPAWKFGAAAALDRRPDGARIDLSYRYGQIGYRYDRASNTWRRYVGGKLQRDRANDMVVAPTNVVVMEVAFGLLGPGQKGRLEAANIGTGRAWIATNGVTIKGTWRKGSVTGATRFYDAAGRPAVLTPGQTFIQVIPPGTPLKITAGKRILDAASAEAQGFL